VTPGFPPCSTAKAQAARGRGNDKIHSMKTTPSQYARALLALSKEKSSSDQAKIAADFLNLMRRKGESKKLSSIVKKMEHLQDAKMGTKHISVTTAHPINAELMKELETFARKNFESKEVILDIRTDKKLLGGVVMKTDNHMVDASVVWRIKSLKKTLLT
jgi:F0F1-type ATP synthase delta subunit